MNQGSAIPEYYLSWPQLRDAACFVAVNKVLFAIIFRAVGKNTAGRHMERFFAKTDSSEYVTDILEELDVLFKIELDILNEQVDLERRCGCRRLIQGSTTTEVVRAVQGIQRRKSIFRRRRSAPVEG